MLTYFFIRTYTIYGGRKMVNNVHVSGKIINKKILNEKFIQLELGIESNEKIIPISTKILLKEWNRLIKSFPEIQSISISGTLFKDYEPEYDEEKYIIKTLKTNSLSCFHNLLSDSLNESKICFYGPVTLQKKLNYTTNSQLILKRMIFETEENVVFEATAIRSLALFFDNIEEGAKLLLKANYIIDKKGFAPYWIIKHYPEQISH